jgi:hypothetical protein
MESKNSYLQVIDAYVDRIGRMLGGAGTAKKILKK